ncbi:MAG: hypothetical protein JWN92_888 [Candidatus Acidoferrum typicum]|nr:hypothetical protein [Candidatus Acidoferrum typicum]
MPKRVIDFDAMWGSDKLASCAEWAQAEYAWLYGLADASGCFELTNLRVIWGRVAAIRRNLSLERLEQIFHEFHDKGLLFVWEENGKRYGHWTGSDVPGRLPAPSWRIRLERLAPPVPKQQFAEFMSRFSLGKAASPGGGFAGESLPQRELERINRGDEELKQSLEVAQGQDWKWNQNQKQKREGCETPKQLPYLPNLNSKSESQQPEPINATGTRPELNQSARAVAAGSAASAPASNSQSAGNSFRERDKSFAVSRELMVGQGPRCGPVRVKPEALDRIRAREGSRSP